MLHPALIVWWFWAGFSLADDGDDFSNNLFSDLAPVLALFGERVTMQFMSQSMGWADNLILAMGPLGIITIIISAIRVGGPKWLKALVGRAGRILRPPKWICCYLLPRKFASSGMGQKLSGAWGNAL
ncbi:hypothetical protein V2G26_004381 [Clonostachys chloroleuca]